MGDVVAWSWHLERIWYLENGGSCVAFVGEAPDGRLHFGYQGEDVGPLDRVAPQGSGFYALHFVWLGWMTQAARLRVVRTVPIVPADAPREPRSFRDRIDFWRGGERNLMEIEVRLGPDAPGGALLVDGELQYAGPAADPLQGLMKAFSLGAARSSLVSRVDVDDSKLSFSAGAEARTARVSEAPLLSEEVWSSAPGQEVRVRLREPCDTGEKRVPAWYAAVEAEGVSGAVLSGYGVDELDAILWAAEDCERILARMSVTTRHRVRAVDPSLRHRVWRSRHGEWLGGLVAVGPLHQVQRRAYWRCEVVLDGVVHECGGPTPILCFIAVSRLVRQWRRLQRDSAWR